MTQEILYQSPGGIVLASDSLVVHIREDGEKEYLAACKLLPLGQWAVLVTAGTYVGVELSRQFAALAQGMGLRFLEQLQPVAIDFFEEEYGHFVKEHQGWFSAHPLAYRTLYVLLAGRADDAGPNWRILFLCSEEHELPFRQLRIGEVLTIPRRLGLEGQLMQRQKEAAELEDVAAFCYSALHLLAERDPEQVGRPIYVAILDGGGFRWWQPTAELAR